MKAVLFDLDGTLVDSSEGITKCAQFALRHFGIEEPDLEKLKSFIGPPLLWSFQKYYGLTEEQAKVAVTEYRKRYVPIGSKECSLYPHVVETLRALKELGYYISVASSKPEALCRSILQDHGAAMYFDEIVGATEDGRIGTKSEVLAEVFRRMGPCPKENMILVGDTIYDVEGANEMGISCVGVSFGFGDLEEMKAANAVGIVDSMEELEQFIVAWFKE